MRKILQVYNEVRNSNVPEAEKSLIIKTIKQEYRQSIKELATTKFWAFCEYCLKDEQTGEHVELQDFHVEWCNLVQATKKLVLFSSIESGKCVDGNSLVALSDGTRKLASEIVIGDEVLSMDSRWKIQPTKVVATECNGHKDLLNITTQSGRNIKVTANHKFYILGEKWIATSRLKIGDRIATPRLLPVKNGKANIDNRIELLGYLIAEGHLNSSTPSITTADDDILNRVRFLVESLDLKLSNSDGRYTYRICKKGKKNPTYKSSIADWLEEIGLLGKKSHTKLIPECVFSASNDEKALFLSALFSGDGHVRNGKPRLVSYTSVSKRLINDVQSLLLHFGILSQIHSRYTKYDNSGKEFLSYRLMIGNKESLLNFKNTVKYLYPIHKTERMEAWSWDRISCGNLDGIPVAWKKYQYWNDFRHEILYGKNPAIMKYEVTSRERVYQIANNEINDSQIVMDFVNPKVLMDLATSDIFWDKIVSIENAGDDLTYDIQVEDNHNFIVNNFITHNSSILSIGYPLFVLGNNASLRAAIVSNVATAASKFLGAIKEYILRDKDVQAVFPDLKPMKDRVNPNRNEKWTDSAIIVERPFISKDFSLQTLGVKGPLLSSRLNLLILDDVLDKKNTDSETENTKIIEWHDAIAKGRLVTDAQEIVVGTAWGPSDMMHYLSDKEEYTTVKYSVEQEDVDAGTHKLVYWPDRHPREKLDAERRYNPDEYNRQRRSRVSSRDTQEFHDYVENYIDKSVEVGEDWIKFTGIDLSSSKRPGDVICDVAVSPDLQKRVVVDIEYGQWKANIRAEHIGAHYDVHNPIIVSVEDNALQSDNLEWMEVVGYKHLPLQGFTTTGANKDGLVMNNAIELRNGLWRFKVLHDFDEICKCHWCRFIKEVKNYPDYKTSDGFMAWLLASEAARSIASREPRFRILDLNQDIATAALLANKPVFTLADYSINNRLTSPDFIPPPDYADIVKEIIRNDGNVVEFDIYDSEDVLYVHAEMNRVIGILNGES